MLLKELKRIMSLPMPESVLRKKLNDLIVEFDEDVEGVIEEEVTEEVTEEVVEEVTEDVDDDGVNDDEIEVTE